MVDTKALRAMMKERQVTQRKLAKELGISYQHMRRKLISGQFWPCEIQCIVDSLHIQDPEPLFFTNGGTHHAPDGWGADLRF